MRELADEQSLRVAVRLAYDSDRDSLLVAHLAARLLVAQGAAVPLQAVSLERRCPQCGQRLPRVPSARGPFGRWFLSISHTRGFAAVAASPTTPIGIDAEATRDAAIWKSLVAAVFSGPERVAVLADERPRRSKAVGEEGASQSSRARSEPRAEQHRRRRGHQRLGADCTRMGALAAGAPRGRARPRGASTRAREPSGQPASDRAPRRCVDGRAARCPSGIPTRRASRECRAWLTPARPCPAEHARPPHPAEHRRRLRHPRDLACGSADNRPGTGIGSRSPLLPALTAALPASATDALFNSYRVLARTTRCCLGVGGLTNSLDDLVLALSQSLQVLHEQHQLVLPRPLEGGVTRHIGFPFV